MVISVATDIDGDSLGYLPPAMSSSPGSAALDGDKLWPCVILRSDAVANIGQLVMSPAYSRRV